jgi:hypothetical protein
MKIASQCGAADVPLPFLLFVVGLQTVSRLSQQSTSVYSTARSRHRGNMQGAEKDVYPPVLCAHVPNTCAVSCSLKVKNSIRD